MARELLAFGVLVAREETVWLGCQVWTGRVGLVPKEDEESWGREGPMWLVERWAHSVGHCQEGRERWEVPSEGKRLPRGGFQRWATWEGKGWRGHLVVLAERLYLEGSG